MLNLNHGKQFFIVCILLFSPFLLPSHPPTHFPTHSLIHLTSHPSTILPTNPHPTHLPSHPPPHPLLLSGHCVFIGWRVASQLAATDVEDLRALVTALRASGCDNALRSRPVFDTTDPLLAACEQELCDIFEGNTTSSPPTPPITTHYPPPHTLHPSPTQPPLSPRHACSNALLLFTHAFLPLIFYHCFIMSCLLYRYMSFLGLRRYSSLNTTSSTHAYLSLLFCHSAACTPYRYLYLSRSFLGFCRRWRERTLHLSLC